MSRHRHLGSPALLLLLAAAACLPPRNAPTNAPPPCTAPRVTSDYDRERLSREREWEARLANAKSAVERERLNAAKIGFFKRADTNYWTRYAAALKADSLSGCRP